MSNPKTPELDGPARIRLALALSRATLTPFGPCEWGAFAGAMGDAHMVRFHDADHDYLADRLGVSHVPRECFTVILDEGGLTWNISSPVNMYGWQVCVSMDVSVHEVPTVREFWESDLIGSDLDREIAAVEPPDLRALIMACPEEARPHVLRGLKRAQADSAEKRLAAATRELLAAARAAGVCE